MVSALFKPMVVLHIDGRLAFLPLIQPEMKIILYQFIECDRTVTVYHAACIQGPFVLTHEGINFIPPSMKMAEDMIAAIALPIPLRNRKVTQAHLPLVVNDPHHLIHRCEAR